MIKLSVTIITLNEQDNIEECIKSLKDLADEVIVIDSGSLDDTIGLAKKSGANVYKRVFDNFARQKNFAADKATGEWILSIDADERVTKELAEEIKQVMKADQFVGFLIPRKNFILGGEIRHSRWSPDSHIWLWKRGSGKWEGEVHEEIAIAGPIGKLKNGKMHYSHKTVKEFLRVNNLYSSIAAKQIMDSGEKFSVPQLLWDPLYEFTLRYIYKWGFLDGWRGFILCYLMGIYKLSVWVKLWEFKEGSPK